MPHKLLKPLAITFFLIGGCASIESQVVTHASRDFSCAREQTTITDQFGGIYRLEGCGFAATYECRENASLRVSCEAINEATVASRAASAD